MPGPLKTDPDRDLILECQRSLGEGFGGAFREVYELYKDRVYNVCYRVTGNATDALDASPRIARQLLCRARSLEI